MALEWKQEGKWFSVNDIGVVEDEQVLENVSEQPVFCLVAKSVPKPVIVPITVTTPWGQQQTQYQTQYVNVDPGEITDDLIYQSYDNFGGLYGGHYLTLSLNTNETAPNDHPVILNMDIDICADIDDGLFACGFLKSVFNNVEYTLQIVDLKINGTHNIYVQDNTGVITYPWCLNKITLTMEFISDHNISDIVPCMIKINDYILGTINFPNIQKHDLYIYTGSSGNGGIDISDLEVKRLVECAKPLKCLVKITQKIDGNKIILSVNDNFDPLNPPIIEPSYNNYFNELFGIVTTIEK